MLKHNWYYDYLTLQTFYNFILLTFILDLVRITTMLPIVDHGFKNHY